MVLNFDDTLEEPDLLPGRFPNLLVNGSSGIAVGMSTNIPTHNLGEVIDGVCAYIDNSKITLDEMMNYIPAPDFPTGALIIKSDGIREAYETGKGKVIMRAKCAIEKDGDKECIVITEIPFQVNKAELLKRINGLRETKKDLYGGIQDINDESNRDGIRCVIKIKKEASAKRILAGLYKSTQLECAFNVNMMAIADGKPEQLSLLGYISRYVEFQREVIFRRSEYELTAASNRAHILEGLLIAVNNIRRVVDIVLSSPTYEESKETLRKEFNLTDKQATAVLDIPLKRLNRLDVHKMEEELENLKKRIAELQAILESKKKQLSIVKKELLEIKAKFATPRITQIVDEQEHPQMIKAEEIIEAHLVSGYVLLNYQGTLRFLTDKSYKMAQKNIVNCAPNELVKRAIKVNGDEKLIAMTKNGQACVFSVDMLTEDKWKSKGTTINKLGKLDSDDAIVALFGEAELKDKELYFATQNGMIKKTEAAEYPMDKKSTYPAIVLKDDDKVINVEIVDKSAEYIVFVTELGNILNAFADVPEQGRRSAGVKGIKLNEKDKVKYCAQNKNEGEVVVILANGTAKRVILPSIDPKNRYGKGVTLCDISKPKDLAFVSLVTEPYDFAIFFVDGDLVAVSTDDIDIEARTSKGKNLLKKVAKKKYESVIYAIYAHNLI